MSQKFALERASNAAVTQSIQISLATFLILNYSTCLMEFLGKMIHKKGKGEKGSDKSYVFLHGGGELKYVIDG